MKVILKRDFNGPGDQFYMSKHNPHEMDEDLLPHLPTDAVIVGKTRDETRLMVLKVRREQNLDAPRDPANPIRLTSDEDLLKRLDTKNLDNKAAERQKAIDAATVDLEAANAKLAGAQTDDEKSAAKSDVKKAQAALDAAKA